jgi:hypothetical protein
MTPTNEKGWKYAKDWKYAKGWKYAKDCVRNHVKSKIQKMKYEKRN